ncbi:MAG: energy-coupling factor transporter transmembrane component T [Adlercreutzia sp.]|nr:energy-coupling factor transporter transmembrane component T [Adlercreutzia sp.]
MKLGWLLAYSLALFVAQSALALGALGLLLAGAIAVTRVSAVRIACDAVFVYPLALVIFCCNGAFQGWGSAGLVTARIILLAFASILLMRTTSSVELTMALRQLLTPLGRLGLPAHDFASALSLALRFIPLMTEELVLVRAAQQSRGASFDAGAPLVRLRAAAALMMPVFVGLFRRADRLASAMDARCFGAVAQPTQLVERRFTLADGGALFLGVVGCFGLALLL